MSIENHYLQSVSILPKLVNTDNFLTMGDELLCSIKNYKPKVASKYKILYVIIKYINIENVK